jgi:hypothetical protein
MAGLDVALIILAIRRLPDHGIHPKSQISIWRPERGETSNAAAPQSQSNQKIEKEMNARMVRDGHGLPKVSPGPAIPDPSTHCKRTTPKMALWPFRGWAAHRLGSLRPSSTPLDTPRGTGLFE